LKNKSILLAVTFIVLIFSSCKKENLDLEKIVLPDPILALSTEQIALGDITSSSKGNFRVSKKGVGSAKFEITSDKKWLILSKNNANLDSTKNAHFDFITDIEAKDIIEGENTAKISINSTINGLKSTEKVILVKGTYKITKLAVNTNAVDFGTIKDIKTTTISLSKIGLENLTFEAKTSASWITIDKTSGTLTSKTDINIAVDPNNLTAGKFDGKIIISPKVNGISKPDIEVSLTGMYDDVITGTISAHTLAKNEKWGGNITLTGTVIVPNGKTLTINPGTKINVVAKSGTNTSRITAYGSLIANGNVNNIIEFKSAENLSNGDWEGLEANGDIELSYAYIKNAVHGLSFYQYSSLNNPKKAASIHHILFDNNVFGISNFQSYYDSKINNITFKNIQLFSFFVIRNQKTQIVDCEFASKTCYLDIASRSDNADISIENCNFVTKTSSAFAHLEIIDTYKNNKVSSTNCYQLNNYGGFNKDGNTYTIKSTNNAPNANIGCGFDNRYASASGKIATLGTGLNKYLKK
jgi:hypothetical protein